ncbi:GSCOCG00000158001-RA-CDS [Cotesia congregata]|nr:GSCOCG00000158001-RA-CDS [Cotesia congregata]
MAIPFNLPSEDEADAQSQQLEQLMLDLYAALQQVLRSRSAQHPSRNHRLPRRGGETGASRDHPIVLIDSDLSRLPLPDLVLSAVQQLPSPEPQVTVSAPSSPTRDAAFQFPECSAPVPSPRPRPRRRRLTSESSVLEKGATSRSDSISTACCRHLGHSCNEREWASVGANLRNIADDFHASKNKQAVTTLIRVDLTSCHCKICVKEKGDENKRKNIFIAGIETPYLLQGINIYISHLDITRDTHKSGQGRLDFLAITPSLEEEKIITKTIKNRMQLIDRKKTNHYLFQDAEIEKSRLPFFGAGFPSVTTTTPSSDSFLSMLIPAPLRETLWTTVALYLGWRLVSRLR